MSFLFSKLFNSGTRRVRHAIALSSSMALTCFTILLPRQALANFRCGPNYETYQVFDSNFSTKSGTGVRCVHFTNDNDRSQFIWYGEGYWGSFRYRHLGDSIHFQSPNARAIDIFGNGENGSGVASNLQITTSSGAGGSIPAIIRIGGNWNEVWLRMANGNVSSYTSSLSPIQNCGTNLTAYSVYAPIDLTYYHPNQSYIGVRCVMPTVRTWVGEGARGNSPYFHVGSFTGDASNPSSVRIGAFDICKDSSYICNSYDFGTLTFIGAYVNFRDYLLVQPWNEEWVPR